LNRTERAYVVVGTVVVDGIPLRPLVVHAVVMLLPLGNSLLPYAVVWQGIGQ
jgi:hypothetical protein